jgi:hypothetical protein
MGHSHAIYNATDRPVQFMSMQLDPSRLQQVAGLHGGKGTVLEFMVVGIARDMSKKNDMLATPPQRRGM